jgi:hypothetical protein
MSTTLSGQGLVDPTLVRLRRVVSDSVTTIGQAPSIELTSFQWGVGRALTAAKSMNVPALKSSPTESVSLNFPTISH